MARKISGKILVKAILIADTPLSIGGFGVGDAVDLDLAVNGKGDYYVPATSLMGVLRSRIGGKCADEVFGFQDKVKNNGHASYLYVEDAKLEPPNGLGREIRDGIGINRQTGTTKDGLKYTRAVLPRGTNFTLNMELDLPSDAAEAMNFAGVLFHMLKDIENNGLILGASKSRGLGKFKATEIKAQWYKFPEDMPVWLGRKEEFKSYGEVLTEDKITTYTEATSDSVEFSISWTPVGSVMVKSGSDGGIADMLPLVSGYSDNQITPVIPGSSIKGVLRARAEKILGTILASPLPESDKNPAFISHDLFGSTEAAGRLRVWDIYQQANAIDPSKWIAEDLPVMNESTDHHDHVAIDRFTGGASDSALFNTRTPKRDKAWKNIRIQMDFRRPKVIKDGEKTSAQQLTENEKYQEIALALLLIRDMKAGWLPLGFATHRGMGAINVSNVEIKVNVAGIEFDSFENAFNDIKIKNAWNAFITDNTPQNEVMQNA